MTTSRLAVFVLLAATATAAGAQAQVSAPALQNLTWAVSEFGSGAWSARLPLLLIRGWDQLPAHRLTEAERTALTRQSFAEAAAALRRQDSQTRLDLDKKKLEGTLTAADVAAAQKTLADVAAKLARAEAGLDIAVPPDTLDLKAVWSSGRENLPWPVIDAPALAALSKAHYAVAGSADSIGGYLDVTLSLYSAIEGRVLASWEGRFAPEEAPASMARAADELREALLGRAWAGISLSSNVAGTQVRLGGVWHDLPWTSNSLEPGSAELLIVPPGLPRETRVLDLQASQRLTLALELPAERDRIVLETDPSGASLYVDSRYIGPSPQTIDRPLATTRVRAQSAGYETLAWEIGPQTPSVSKGVLLPPSKPPSVTDAKDRFYWSLAAFSFSLTSSAFLGAWQQEQAQLTSQYAVAIPFNASQYNKAYDRYTGVSVAYGGSVVLTSAIFVWMMFELGAYIAADEATLP